MADDHTKHYDLIKPEVGGSPETWGEKLNSNFEDLDGKIHDHKEDLDKKISDHKEDLDKKISDQKDDIKNGDLKVGKAKTVKVGGNYGEITVSTDEPSGGKDGDIWLVVD